METDVILRVQNLSLELDHQAVIEDVSFTVKKGDLITIMGPNGAGKTVLLKCLLNLLPYTGTIEWEKGIKIGYVPQRLPFIKDIPMSVMDFFALKKASEQEAREKMQALGFKEDLFERKIGELSSGQFQQILIVWSMIGNPHVLLFDEPTSGVDITGEESIYHFLAKLKEEHNLTILLVTHDLSVVYQFSTRVICLNRQVICYGSPHDALTPESLQNLYGTKMKYYQHKHES